MRIWGFAYNTALIPVAAGVLYPFFGITFRPELAGLAMAIEFCDGGDPIPSVEGVCTAGKN